MQVYSAQNPGELVLREICKGDNVAAIDTACIEALQKVNINLYCNLILYFCDKMNNPFKFESLFIFILTSLAMGCVSIFTGFIMQNIILIPIIYALFCAILVIYNIPKKSELIKMQLLSNASNSNDFKAQLGLVIAQNPENVRTVHQLMILASTVDLINKIEEGEQIELLAKIKEYLI